MPYPQRPNGQGSSSSKPLTPHPSLPVNPMTYQPPAPQQPPTIPTISSALPGNYQQPAMPYAYAPTGVPIPAYPAMYGQPQQGMMMMPPSQAYYNPTMALRQSLFQTPVYGYIPTQTPQGYSYSSTYLQQQQQQIVPQPMPVQPPQQATAGPSAEPSSRPTKRARPNIPPTASSTNPNHPAPSTTESTSTNPGTPTPTSYLPMRTKIPLKKGQTEESSQGHWRNCSEPGCHYVGPDREVKVHEEDRHLIGRGAKRSVGGVGKDGGKEDDDRDQEEEERARRAISGPKMPIPGTSITLETPEDIARWIAERKARWPTSERVASKEKERQEKIDRGEIDPHERSGRGGGNRGRERGRGRGRGQDRERGGGGGRGRGGRGGSNAVRGRDNGYGTRGGEGAGVPVKPEGNDEDVDSDGSTSSSSDDDNDDDDEDESAPETNNVYTRVPALPTSLESIHSIPSDVHQPDETPFSGKKEQCRAFIRTGRCKFGSRCRYDHPNKAGGEKNKARGEKGDGNAKPSKVGAGSSTPNQVSNPFARPSLLDAMLKDPLQQTLLTLTETIDFIVDNDFFDGVELVPGQAEEELERRRKVDARIEVVGKEEGAGLG